MGAAADDAPATPAPPVLPSRRPPVDPRLLRVSRGVRSLLLVGVAVAALTAVLVVVQAFALADLITGGFQQGLDVVAMRSTLLVLAAVVLGRAALAFVGELAAGRAASRTSAELRAALLAQVVRLGPVWLTGARRADVSTLATRGIDAIEPYVARYLPQLLVAVVVPVTVAVAILTQDVAAAVLVAVTAPLIPLFMALVGTYTQRATDRQWRALSVLSHHFLDVVAGLPTLKAFGRARVQAAQMRDIDARYRRTTLGVLRISFLSSLVLELLATLSVAAIAVSIGLRLLDGGIDLRTGLVVLILAPEVYLPIRMVGAQFHAAADGVSAAAEVFDVLETPAPTPGSTPAAPDGPVLMRGVSVTYPGASVRALTGLDLALVPGRITALVGPSGAGKSTALAVLLGFLAPDEGELVVGGVPVRELDPATWSRHVGWVGQDPVLLGPTVADDVRLGTDAGDDEVVGALRRAGVPPEDLPQGAATPVGDLASDVSSGQRRRIALARALLRRTPVLLLDEPTAGLDGDSEADVVAVLRAAAAAGTAVLVVAHRPALVAAADDVVTLVPAVAVPS